MDWPKAEAAGTRERWFPGLKLYFFYAPEVQQSLIDVATASDWSNGLTLLLAMTEAQFYRGVIA
jgi:hypothetical protein